MAFDGSAEPGPEILQLIDQTLEDPFYAEAIMEAIRSNAKSNYTEEHYQNIDNLKIHDVIFQSSKFILIQLFGPEDPEPFWFAEVHGSEVHVGFDT